MSCGNVGYSSLGHSIVLSVITQWETSNEHVPASAVAFSNN